MSLGINLTTCNHKESIILESRQAEVKRAAGNAVRVFVTLHAPAGPALRCLEQLHRDEQERYRRMACGKRQQEWLTGRWLACEALTEVLGRVHPAALRTSANGALAYANAALALSLTHSHGLVALALAPTTVGVDVELARPRVLVAHGERIFAVSEAAQMAQASARGRLESFYRYWTLKEAFCKAGCLPLWSALRAAEFDFLSGACHLPVASRGWQFLSARLAQDWLLGLAIQSAETKLPLSVQYRGADGWQSQTLSDPIRLHQADARFQTITQSNGTSGEISAP